MPKFKRQVEEISPPAPRQVRRRKDAATLANQDMKSKPGIQDKNIAANSDQIKVSKLLSLLRFSYFFSTMQFALKIMFSHLMSEHMKLCTLCLFPVVFYDFFCLSFRHSVRRVIGFLLVINLSLERRVDNIHILCQLFNLRCLQAKTVFKIL